MSKPANRARTGRFLPGQSGNPGGRRRRSPDVQAIFTGADAKAAQTLVNLLDSEDEEMRFKSAIAIQDRLHGKPAQALDVVARRAPVDLSTGFEALAGAAVSTLEQALREQDEADARNAAQLSGITQQGDAESNLESGSLDDGSPSENDSGDESQRALIARSTDAGGE